MRHSTPALKTWLIRETAREINKLIGGVISISFLGEDEDHLGFLISCKKTTSS
uniref:Uncharacterized protein n=1 Tax=Candidatus Kentrum sp. TUN TaxID=2126343 RepID=A0A450ZF63_9GAMM|nr:MAG: hypothetical protein BECKTUN1418F_GA0071002_100811 [Candidatus Kentron sp. TUN]VFK52911.1 MAG: hypothetical protein BECKTUN1418E_GA0071001_101111 [Candidatus Kentron sp. TUN]